MGSRKQLKRRLRELEHRDQLRRFELVGADEAIAAADARLRRQKAFSLALAERILAAHEVLAHLAERRAVVLTEEYQCPL